VNSKSLICIELEFTIIFFGSEFLFNEASIFFCKESDQEGEFLGQWCTNTLSAKKLRVSLKKYSDFYKITS